MRVLLVEDNEDDALLIQEALAGTTVKIETSDRLSSALEKLGKGGLDVVLLDLSLPDAVGLESIGRVRCRHPSVPIVILTGLNDEDAALKAVEQGAQDYLIKGQANGELLTRALRYAIQRHRAEERLKERNRELLILRKISETILGSLDLKFVLDRILEETMLSGSFDLGNIRLLNSSGDTLEVSVSRGYRDPRNILSHRRLSRTMETAQSSHFRELVFEQPYMEEHVQACSGLRTMKKEGVESFVQVPVRADGEVLGIIQLASRTPRKFRQEEVNLLETIGNQMGIAVQRARLYEETRDQAIALKKANKGKDEFLSVMSHELRTPVNVIMGYAETLKRGMFGEINPDQDLALGKLVGCSKDLLGMISCILQATIIEAEAMRVEKNEVSIGHLLDELKSVYVVPFHKNIDIHWDYPPELPCVNTDREKLKHILQNLINNAVKFTDKGGVTISASYLPEVKRLKFQVADSGIGISQEEFSIIFEKFRQVDSSDSRAYGGVGLGLFIVKRFTELLRGDLSVSSEIAKGSTFTVTLPIDV
jgi:signal transduction histidine kinase/CheY-like chemotaxis protein